MNCSEQAESIGRWLEARWQGQAQEPPPALLVHAASCRACAARLQAARLLASGSPLRREAPPELAMRVAQRLEGLDQRRGFAGRVPRRLSPAQAARLRWLAVPLAAVLAAALSFGLTTRLLRPNAVATVTVRLLVAAPGAGSVSVVGDWNGWDPARDRLGDPDGDGVWEIRLRLPRGLEARYQFLIDGQQWLADPRAPLQVEDGFGGTSSVLQI
jgi:hypothetical protein